ncbi:MAG TPA: aspartate-semialdehyde dehydrogenase [Gemmatimonadaceae bacterium]|nr:aspartate-semialdehyde dehydrogenase [Gemmatimonadaceae bacterium]
MIRRKLPVAVLGATGAVGQTFVRLLAAHPWFELQELAASERSAGRRYGDAAHWIDGDPPRGIAERCVVPCTPEHVQSPVVFSALDSSVAGEVELAFARAGRFVLSNARNHRMEPDVPLLIPEVNPEHLALLDRQRRERGWEGAIVTNGNCAVIVIAMALAPLHQRFGVRQVFVTTMQAVSGAGYPGVPSLDILGNVIPFIAGEEEKIAPETCKFLGRVTDGVLHPAQIAVSAQVTRVPVQHGHTVSLAVALERRASQRDVFAAFAEWRGAPQARELPSAPERPLILHDAVDRPQPRRDADAGGGMSVTVGAVRADSILDVRLVATGHNTVRGAAGASVLNAELLVAQGVIPAT